MVVVMTAGGHRGRYRGRLRTRARDGGEAFVSRGAVHTVVGLVGDTARFEAIPFTQMAGVDHVIQIGKPYKMVARDLHPEATTVKVGTDGRRTRHVHDHRRTVRRGVRGAGDDRHARSEGGRRHDPARRRVQAAYLAVLVPGPGGARARDPRGMPARHRSAVRRRGRRRLAGAEGRGDRRLHPHRHAQRAELRAAEGGRAHEQARDAEARPRHDDRGVAAGGRVHRAARQLRDHPVRARHPHVRAVHAQHAGPGRHGGRPARVPPPGDRRSVARGRRSGTWWRRWRGRRSRPAPTPS